MLTNNEMEDFLKKYHFTFLVRHSSIGNVYVSVTIFNVRLPFLDCRSTDRQSTNTLTQFYFFLDL